MLVHYLGYGYPSHITLTNVILRFKFIHLHVVPLVYQTNLMYCPYTADALGIPLPRQNYVCGFLKIVFHLHNIITL